MSEQVDYTVNTFNKMIVNKMIRKDNRGMMIQLKNIHDKLREDGTCWNRRGMDNPGTLSNIDAIFDHLNSGGQVPAIEVQPREGGGVVKIDGYCRTEAWRKMDASGEGDLWVYIVPFEGDELDALVRIETSNRDRKLTPLEQLDLYQSARAELKAMGEKATLQQIADLFKVSRQYIDQILKLEALGEEERKLLDEGKVTTKQAIAAIRKGGEKQAENLQQQAKANADRDNPKPPTVSKELFVDMYSQVEQIRKAMPKETMADVQAFLSGTASSSTIVQIRVGELAKLMALLGEGDRQLEARAAKAKSKDEESRQEEMAHDDLKQDLDDEPGFFDEGGGHEGALDTSKLTQQAERGNDEPDLSFL